MWRVREECGEGRMREKEREERGNRGGMRERCHCEGVG